MIFVWEAVLPITSFAFIPMFSILSVFKFIAMYVGSSINIPSFLTYTTVFAVPRSIPTSLDADFTKLLITFLILNIFPSMNFNVIFYSSSIITCLSSLITPQSISCS